MNLKRKLFNISELVIGVIWVMFSLYLLLIEEVKEEDETKRIVILLIAGVLFMCGLIKIFVFVIEPPAWMRKKKKEDNWNSKTSSKYKQ